MDKIKESKSRSNVIQIEPDGIELKSGLFIHFAFGEEIRMN